jgi:hypothetical protein
MPLLLHAVSTLNFPQGPPGMVFDTAQMSVSPVYKYLLPYFSRASILVHGLAIWRIFEHSTLPIASILQGVGI